MKISGKINFSIIGDAQMGVDKLLNQFEKQLSYEGAKNIEPRGDIITFSGVWFRFRLTCKLLDIIDRGFIKVFIQDQKLIVAYRLSFLRIFWLSLFAALIAFILLLVTTSDLEPSLIVFFLVFGSALGINLISAIVSIQVLIRSVWSVVFRESLFWKVLYVIAS